MARFAQEHEVTLHRHGGFGRPPKPMDARAEALFGFVRQCGADLGLSIAWRDTGGVCDGNNIAACGVPVVDTMGVRGGNIHSDLEYLVVDSLAERAQLRSEEHTSELQSRMRTSYAVFCLKQKNIKSTPKN